jgi:predicted nucleic acid-binding protein
MNILFDTNVVLDVMLDRQPFSKPASIVFSFAEKGDIQGFLCATTVTTIHYLATKALGKNRALKQIKNLTTLFDIACVNGKVIEESIDSEFSDFEDSVIYHSAVHAGVEAIVTRDSNGFKASKLPVFGPAEILKMIESIG